MNTCRAGAAAVIAWVTVVVGVEASADEYTLTSVNKDAAFIVNEATLAQPRQGTKRAWVMVVSSPLQPSDGPAWRQQLTEFDCAEGRFRFLSIVNYGPFGDVTGGVDEPSAWMYAPPRANMDNTRAYVCGAAIFPAVKLGDHATPEKAAASMVELYRRLPQ